MPGREFSRAIRSDFEARVELRLVHPARAAVAPRPARDWSSSRRFRPSLPEEEFMDGKRLGGGEGSGKMDFGRKAAAKIFFLLTCKPVRTRAIRYLQSVKTVNSRLNVEKD